MALLWTGLALWAAVSRGSPESLILLAFGLLNLAMAGRVIFPGREAA
jgi:hypothetical protein